MAVTPVAVSSSESDWVTLPQAADLLGCVERTIQRRARAGRIATRTRAGFPTLYRVEDVEMLRRTGYGEVRGGIVETRPPASTNGNGHLPVAGELGPLAGQVLQALLQTLTHGATGATLTGTTWVTLSEASAITGLSEKCLRAMIRHGYYEAVRDRRQWMIRREHLL